jgi:NADPH2:quinone reductase
VRAIQVVDTTGLDGVRLVDVPEPTLPEGGVLIDVRCAGLSFPDVLLCQGLYQMKPELPFTLGVEAAGVVREAAPGSGFKPGDRVTAFGSAAGAEVMASGAENVCRLPDALSFEEGAALTMNFHTAHFALVRRGRLRAGETVLVQGAGGGVGSAAVQVAAAKDARVIAAVSSDAKAEVARGVGAAEVVRVDQPDWRSEVMKLSGGRGVNVAFDPVGGERFRESMRCLAPEGRIIVIGFAEGSIPEVGANRILFRNVDVVGAAWGAFLVAEPGLTRDIAADLEPLINAGRIKPWVSSVLPLEEATEGLKQIAERRVLGKVVLRVSE